MTDQPDRAGSPIPDRGIVVVSNRGPVNLTLDENGQIQTQRSGGGLVTALLGIAQHVELTWMAAALNDLEASWGTRELYLTEGHPPICLQLVPVSKEAYEGYYNVIANPLLWFLQHSMWDFIRSPNINHATWEAWENGYVAVNRVFAQALAQKLKTSKRLPLVMLQDYHLYLAPRMLRNMIRQRRQLVLTHFIHIPWPGAEDWGDLPARSE